MKGNGLGCMQNSKLKTSTASPQKNVSYLKEYYMRLNSKKYLIAKKSIEYSDAIKLIKR